jgi:hypothetical protein
VKVHRKRLESPEESRGIALHSLDHGARKVGWSAPRLGCFTSEKVPVLIVQEAGWAPWPVLTCAKNSAPTGIFFYYCLRLFRVMYFVLVFDEGLRAVDFSIMKNPTASVGSEPAILGSRGQHANP